MSQVTTAITLADAIALFGSVVNDRITIHTSRPIVLLGGKKNAMQGKVFKVCTYRVNLGSAHSYEKKRDAQGKAIATHESIETDTDVEYLKNAVRSLWKGAGEHVSGAIVRHKGTDEKYLYYFPISGEVTETTYLYEGKEILPENIVGFNEKDREGALVGMTDGSVHETKVFPTALKMAALKGFRMGGIDYMISDNIG